MRDEVCTKALLPAVLQGTPLKEQVKCARVYEEFVRAFSKVPHKRLLRKPGNQRIRGEFPP